MEYRIKGPMRAGYFKLRPLSEEIFEGFTMGEKWDYWDCPYFTYEEARRFLKIYNEPLLIIGNYNTAFYDLATDSFVFPGDDENEPEIYRATIEDGNKYYQLGAFWWFWKEVSK